MDTNRDGTLEWEEFASAMRRMVKLTDDDMRCLRQIFDENGDGDVAFDEFMASYLPNLLLASAPRCAGRHGHT